MVSIAKENSLSVNLTRDIIKQSRAKISPLYEDFFIEIVYSYIPKEIAKLKKNEALCREHSISIQ